MEQKNRFVIAMIIIVLILGAILTSFGRSLFAKNPPRVVLPEPNTGQSTGDASGSGDASNQLQRVEVTPETVQSVIATLARTSSYYREVTVELFWEGGEQTTAVQTWVDGDWTHTCQTLPNGLKRHDLIGGGEVRYWYEGERTWRTAPAGEAGADLAQRIPTYETVLELDPASIAAAGYELLGDVPCIYVQVQSALAGYEDCYWIGVDSGLLECAQSLESGQVVYRMTASPIQSEAGMENAFTLPDGTVLYSRAGEQEGLEPDSTLTWNSIQDSGVLS